MTKEEAINELEILKENYWDDDGYGHETKQYDDTMFALDMAIKALEKEPTTKNDKEQEDITWIVGNDNVQIAVRNMPVDMMQKICAIIGNKQEVSTKNDLGVDCISRAEAIKCLECDFDITGKENMKTVVNYINSAHDKIVNLPSVTPQEPKTGHWISHREHCENLGVMPSGLGAYEWCSNCDCGIDVREWYRNHYNYCPNCGCRMVEPQESEDNNK